MFSLRFHSLYLKLLLSQIKNSGPLEFEITRVDCISLLYESEGYIIHLKVYVIESALNTSDVVNCQCLDKKAKYWILFVGE